MSKNGYSPTSTDEKIEEYCNEDSIDEIKYSKPNEPNCVVRRIHILSWISSYNREFAIADLIAGITLGLTIIPQSIAYAALAGLSSEYGLYSAFIGSIIYVFFGTIPQVSIGPTSLMALMVLQYCANKPPQFVIMLAFLSGLVELLMGLFRLGFIVNFIPAPVNRAFTTSTALIIALAQLKNLFGVKVKGIPSVTTFWNNISYGDAILGISSLIILLSLRQLSQINFKRNTKSMQYLKKLTWYLSISRNALVVFLSALVTFLWIRERSKEAVPYALSANAESAKLSVHVPPFAFEHKNTTYMFADIVRELGSGIFVVPLVAVLANVAIAKAFVTSGTLDASQEMFTLGLCNLAGSFFSAMPTCGAFTRSAVSNSSGVKTPMAGIYTGLLVLSALSVLTPYCRFIPKSTLAAVLIAAVLFMMDFGICKKYWQHNKKDFFSWMGTFIVCLLAGVEMGLFFGILLNIIFILLRLGNPNINVTLEEINGNSYVRISPITDIYFTGIDQLRTVTKEACVLYKHNFPLVIDCQRFRQFDSNFSEMITSLAKDLHKQDVILVLHNLKQDLQQHVSADLTNLHFCNGELKFEDFAVKR